MTLNITTQGVAERMKDVTKELPARYCDSCSCAVRLLRDSRGLLFEACQSGDGQRQAFRFIPNA